MLHLQTLTHPLSFVPKLLPLSRGEMQILFFREVHSYDDVAVNNNFKCSINYGFAIRGIARIDRNRSFVLQGLGE